MFFLKIEMKEKLEATADIITLQMPVAQFSTYKINSKELLIHGQYFDFKTTEVSGDSIRVTGIWDIKESKLKKSMDENLETNYSKKAFRLFPILLTPFILVEPGLFALSDCIWRINKIGTTISHRSYNYIKDLIKPPGLMY